MASCAILPTPAGRADDTHHLPRIREDVEGIPRLAEKSFDAFPRGGGDKRSRLASPRRWWWWCAGDGRTTVVLHGRASRLRLPLHLVPLPSRLLFLLSPLLVRLVDFHSCVPVLRPLQRGVLHRMGKSPAAHFFPLSVLTAALLHALLAGGDFWDLGEGVAGWE